MTATPAAAWLHQADRLLREPALLSDGLWPRTCVWLIRLALEHAIDEYWDRHHPEIGRSARRSQLIVLACTVDAEIGRRCAFLWHTLSNAAHHHAYDLAPTAAELRMWHDEASALISSRTPRSDTPPAAPAASSRPEDKN
jgi:hypothetical protein